MYRLLKQLNQPLLLVDYLLSQLHTFLSRMLMHLLYNNRRILRTMELPIEEIDTENFPRPTSEIDRR